MRRIFFLFTFLIGKIAFCEYNYELSIAAIFQNEAPYLEEWIIYHRMVGVEHFFLYNDRSTDNWEEILQPYIAEGIIEVVDWPSPLLGFIPTQVRAYRDALTKSTGVTKWLAIIDIDEFLLPQREKTVVGCLNNHFSNASGLYVNWHNFGTGGVHLRENDSVLFSLTSCSDYYHPRNSVGKSIVRPDRTCPDKVWNPHHFVLEPDAHYCDGSGRQLTFNDLDLSLDGKSHKKFIQINHYAMRDEHFFHNVRLERAKNVGIEESLIWELYHAYNKSRDFKIIEFIKKRHPQMHEKYWKHRRSE